MLESILITGANGEIGQGLIKKISKFKNIISLDINDIDSQIKPFVKDCIKGSILDKNIISLINDKYNIVEMGHNAQKLYKSEFNSGLRKKQIIKLIELI